MIDRKAMLSGGPEDTVTWIWLEDGQLKVQYYDFSESTENALGDGIAYMLSVEEMSKVFSLSGQSRDALLPWMAQNF